MPATVGRDAGQGRPRRLRRWNAARTGPTTTLRHEGPGARRPAKPRARCTTTARANTPASSAWVAMLAGGGDRRAFVRGYVQPGHAVMREVTAALQASHRLGPVGARRCRHRRLLDPHLRHPAAAPGPCLRARRHRASGLQPGPRRGPRSAPAPAPSPARRYMVAGSGRFDSRADGTLPRTRVLQGGRRRHVLAPRCPQLGLGVAHQDGRRQHRARRPRW